MSHINPCAKKPDVLKLGAIHKVSQQYVPPSLALKTEAYQCPECEKDVIFKKGEIRTPHFAHFSDTEPCNYYEHPSESQIHKDAKQLMKYILENRTLQFNRICIGKGCKLREESPIEFSGTKLIQLEYAFKHNETNKCADVACLDDNELFCIIEICHTHKTHDEDRPEPWFEVDAMKFIKTANTELKKAVDIVTVDCIRKKLCESCDEKQKLKELNNVYLRKCRNCENCVSTNYIMHKKEQRKARDTKLPMIDYHDQERIYFNVPFDQKENIKKLCGKWCPTYKKWYVFSECTKILYTRSLFTEFEICYACNGTGKSYWMEDMYGPCMSCCCIDCANFSERCKCIRCKLCSERIENGEEHICSTEEAAGGAGKDS